MADNRAVGHQEQGFGDERAERGNGERDDLAVMPSAGSLGRRGSLCHGHQCNRPQVRDARQLRPLLVLRRGALWRATRTDLAPTGKVFLLHSRWMGKCQVRMGPWRRTSACSQRCPPGRAQFSATSPQRRGCYPQSLWITRLADGARGPTVVRRPSCPPLSESSQNRRVVTGVGALICQCRAVGMRGTARSAPRTGGGGPVSISEPLDEPWADSGPSDRLPVSRQRGERGERGERGRGREDRHDRGGEGSWEGVAEPPSSGCPRRTSTRSSRCSAACSCPRTPSPTSSRSSRAMTSTGPHTRRSTRRSSICTRRGARRPDHGRRGAGQAR